MSKISNWTTAEEKYLIDKLSKHVHPVDFVEDMNNKFHTKRSADAIERKCRRLNLPVNVAIPKDYLASAPPRVVQEHINLERTVAKYKSQLTIANRKYNELVKLSNTQEQLVTTAERCIQALPPAPIFKPAKITKGTTTEEAILLLSDLHVGEVVNPDEIGGFNAYNIEIFRYRMKYMEQSILDIVKDKLSGYSIPKLHILGLGDWISGHIHQELIETGDGDIMEWVLGATTITAQFIRNLAAQFPSIEFTGVVGNHGRFTKKPTFKRRYVNWDYLSYQMLKMMLINQKNITFEIPKSFWTIKTINGHNFLILHGDNVNSYNGVVPWYGIDRTIARLKELLESKEIRFDYIVLGHFHNRSLLDRVRGELIVNGSLIGGSEYSIGKLFTSSVASQHFGGVHTKRGTTWSYKLRVQDAVADLKAKGIVTPPYEYLDNGILHDFDETTQLFKTEKL